MNQKIYREIQVAADWWSALFFDNFEMRNYFGGILSGILFDRYKMHWYPQVPHRGQAFRSIAFDKFANKIDSAFVEAARVANVDISPYVKGIQLDEIIMWVDPGSVVVKRVQVIGYHTDETELVIFDQGEVIHAAGPGKSDGLNFLAPSPYEISFDRKSPITFNFQDFESSVSNGSREDKFMGAGQTPTLSHNTMYARNIIH
eukprot:TRINITY_DN10771_c0_g1_i1.p1 TRINITY_DN10771_c0_g1~~TRINITY_DN10771_c0_g1_i1.p1  ORF type:complete len:214 (-),score=43.41 TRINITY_DN10771_c0_g1_i1:75-680(-)